MNTAQTLSGKEIVVAVTGSIAAVETVKLIHALRRRGATIQTVMTPAAEGIVSADALTYASGRKAITRLSGCVEHVVFCGDGGRAHLLLIAPCTANTISKIASGIDDTPVTTFATTALGSGVPVIVVPAMHHSMYRHPAIGENIGKLKAWGVGIVEPHIEEGKAKLASIDEIVLRCERAVLAGPLSGKRVLITSGPCQEPVDDVRVLTTRSSGQMGRALALEAFRLGAEVTIVHNDEICGVTNKRCTSSAEMQDAVLSTLGEVGTDIYISAAALSDFAPELQDAKIPSGKPAVIRLNPLPKLIDRVLAEYSPFVIAFKLDREPEKKARAMLQKGVSLVLMNSPETMGNSCGDYVMISSKKRNQIRGSKEEIARAIWEIYVAEYLHPSDKCMR